MTNIIGYNKFPDRVQFSEQYQTMSQSQLALIYGCGKKRIKKWIEHFGLELRCRGGGNNYRYDVNIDYLKQLVSLKYTNDDIAKKLGMSISNLNRILKKHSIQRNYQTSEYAKYSQKVRRLTENTYVQFYHIINPNGFPRTLCGVEGGYQVDHFISVRECFDSGISEEDCSSLTNLEMIPWRENLDRRKIKRIKV